MIFVLSTLTVVTMLATVTAQPVPEGFAISGLVNNYCTDESVNNADVKVTNLNTSGVFSTETAQIFWWANYRFRITSGGVSAGNVLQFNVSDNQGNSTEFNYTITHEDTFYSGFKQDITIGVCGDENCDSEANMVDTGAVIAHIYHDVTLCNLWAANVNCDSEVNMMDAGAMIANIYHATSLNCCECNH